MTDGERGKTERRAAALTLAACLACAAALPASGPAAAKPKKAPEPFRVIYLQPVDGPERVRSDEVLLGLRTALGADFEGDASVDLIPAVLPADGKPLTAAIEQFRKDKTALLLASVPDGRTAGLQKAAGKIPLIVLSPEPTRPSIDPKRTSFWAGGMRPVWESLYALDFLLQPLGSRAPAILHDGSERARRASEKCLTQHHVEQAPKKPAEVTEAFGAEAVKKLVDDGADGIVYFGGPGPAERLLQAVDEAGVETPVLLGQGLASEAVPTFHAGGAPGAWAIDATFFEDQHDQLSDDDKWVLSDAMKAAGKQLRPATARGYRVGRWMRRALGKAASIKAKHVLPALKQLGRAGASGKPVFEPWGHASLVRLEPWRSPEVRESPPCHKVRHTLVPMAGIPQIGFFSPDRFAWEKDTLFVYVRFGEKTKRSIEKDLQAIGLHTKGYEVDLEKRILDDLLGRVISKLNQKFLRSPDGTSIPGVSFAISFSASPPSKDVRSAQRWYVIIDGDDPVAGGRASGNVAKVFPTFIQRTIYVKHKLDPVVSSEDRKFITGRYKWGTSVDENLRGDLVRSLLDGFAGSMGLTGAHELGHLAGCGHDQDSPRSIMNVAEGAGLEFEWGEWSPAHVQIVEKRLKRVPAE